VPIAETLAWTAFRVWHASAFVPQWERFSQKEGAASKSFLNFAAPFESII
jgi:hypothetical protein